MGGVVGEGVLRALVAEVHRIDAGEEVLAPAEEYGGDHEVHLVDQPGGVLRTVGATLQRPVWRPRLGQRALPTAAPRQ